MNSRNLTAQEQRRLEAALRHTQDARQYRRTLAILEYSRGKGVVEIARMLRVTRQSVYNWIVKFAPSHDLAQLADAPRCGRPARCRQQHQPLLDQLLQCRPDELGYWATQWTVPLLQEQLWHSTGEKYSEATLRRTLHGMGYVWKRARYVLAPDPEREKKNQIRRALRCLPARGAVLAQDETDLLLCPPLRKQWARQGQPASVLLGGGNARRVIFGAMNLATGHRLWLPRRRQRAEDFQAFLRQVHAQYRGWQVLLLVDRDASHTAHQSIRLAQQFKIRLLWLPKRCPELNPMEALWGHAKNVVSANRQYANIDCQVKRFIDYLSALTGKQALQTAGMFSKHFWLHRIASIKFCRSA